MDLLELGKRILASQPFSQYMQCELKRLDEGFAELSLDILEDYKQHHGFVHGGVVSFLADSCLTFAGGSVLGNSVTSEYKINYVRPSIGDVLVAQASVLSAGKSLAVCECKIYAVNKGERKLVAVAQGTIKKVTE